MTNMKASDDYPEGYLAVLRSIGFVMTESERTHEKISLYRPKKLTRRSHMKLA
ncbi:hypothetical protein [Legionella pneumophila]